MPTSTRSSRKASQVAASAHPTHRHSDEPIAESKRYLKLRALASEKIFPTLENLAEEKGLDIEEHHEIPAQPESHDLAPSAWEGKLPEIVKKDIVFTQADTIIINEPADHINSVGKHANEESDAIPTQTEGRELAPAAWKTDALVSHEDEGATKEVDEKEFNRVDHPIEAATALSEHEHSGRNKKKNRKNRQSAPIQEDEISKPSEIAPVSSEEPIAESKANLKPQALASEQIFPTLEGLAEEKGLDTYIDEHDNIPTQPESHDHAAWQGKLPKIVKQKYEFTQADTIIINELGERHTMNEEPAKEVQPAEELVQDEPEAYEEIQPSASKKKKAKKHRHQAPAEKAPVQDEAFEEDEELENPIEDEELSAESKENLKPQALTSTEIFPTLKSLAEEKGIDSYLEERPWAGKLPEIVKQDAEFTQADTIIVDEPAERAAALAKKKQERKERRLQKQKLHQAEQEEEAPIEKEEKELAPSAWPQESQELEKQDGEYMDENQKPAAEKKASEEAELPLPFEAYFRQGTASPQADDKSDEMQLEAPAPLPSIIPAADQLNFAIKTISAEIQQREPFIEGLIVSSASGILGLYFSMVGGVLRLVGLRQISGRLIMGSRSLANSVIDNTPLHRFKVLGQRYKIYRIAARMAGKVDHNVRAQISNEPKSKSVQSLSAPASPESKHAENTRFDSFERFIVGCASSILVMYLSIVAGFLRLFGLRDLSGRLIMGFRSTADNVIEATPLRRVKVFGRKFGAYRMAARVARNVDREVRTQIGSMPAKKEVHFDGENNKKFL